VRRSHAARGERPLEDRFLDAAGTEAVPRFLDREAARAEALREARLRDAPEREHEEVGRNLGDELGGEEVHERNGAVARPRELEMVLDPHARAVEAGEVEIARFIAARLERACAQLGSAVERTAEARFALAPA
jgi:hypothetical protein